jgi:hypothetical protein
VLSSAARALTTESGFTCAWNPIIRRGRVAHPAPPRRRDTAAHRAFRPARRVARPRRRPTAAPPPRGEMIMTAPYLTALGLKEPPFSKEIPDADLWLPASK